MQILIFVYNKESLKMFFIDFRMIYSEKKRKRNVFNFISASVEPRLLVSARACKCMCVCVLTDRYYLCTLCISGHLLALICGLSPTSNMAEGLTYCSKGLAQSGVYVKCYVWQRKVAENCFRFLKVSVPSTSTPEALNCLP